MFANKGGSGSQKLAKAMASIESNEQNNNTSNRYQDINSFMYKNSSRLLNWYLPALREAFYNNLKTVRKGVIDGVLVIS